MKKLTDIELDAAESEAALLEARRANRRMGDDIADSHQRNAALAAQVARQAGRIAELEQTIDRMQELNDSQQDSNERLKDLLTEQGQAQQEAMLRFQGKRIAELEADREAIAASLNGIVEHSGHHMQAERVAMLIGKYQESQRRVIEFAKERNSLRRQLAATLATIEAATHDGRTYAEGCKP